MLFRSLEEIQTKLTAKNQEIEDTRAALVLAQQQSAQQYEDMKKRIQFMYENGTDSMAVLLFEADSISDFLNKAEYVKEISSYDRSMLKSYQKTQEDIAAQEQELEAEQAELASLQNSMQEKKSQVNELISQTQTAISEYNATISDQQTVAADLQTQIEEQKAYEQQLEIQKTKEDIARLAEIRRQEEENAAAAAAAAATPVVSGDSSSDQALLAALIYCEAGGESYEGQLAVGSVVVNRVRSAYYPGSVSGVIYQSGQFSPVASGRFATVLGSNLTSASCAQAAAEVLAGNVTNNFLYFRTNNGLIEGTIIGNHVFY